MSTSTISVPYSIGWGVTETFSGATASDRTAGFDGLTEEGTLTASTTPPATKHFEYDLAMVSGSATINLAALPGLNADQTVVGTGLKLQLLRVRNKSTNTHKVTVAKGGSNGYGLNSAGDSWSVILDPGQSWTFEGNDAAPDVASGARVIDVTGTGTDVLQVAGVLG